MKAVPVTKVEEVISKLRPHMDQLVQLDPFTLQRFKREVKENMHAYPWAGFIALGMLAVLEWDENALDENYRNALALRRDFETRASYAISLHLMGKQEDAMREALIASALAPENLTYLKDVGDYAQNAGRFSVVQEIVETFNLRSSVAQRETMGINELGEAVSVASQILEANNMSEDVAVSCNAIAFRILREHKVPYVVTRTETDVQDKYIMYYIDIAADDNKVEELDQLLGVALFDEVPEFNPDVYWVGYGKAVVTQ